MSITDELRDWASVRVPYKYGHQLTAIADRIDGAHDRAVMSAINDALHHANDESMAELGWVRLPKDADGEHIHIGDVMEFTYDPPQDQPLFEVSGIGADGTLFYAPRGEVFPRKSTKASVVRHHHEPTVEDVLRKFADRVCNSGHQWGLDAADTIAEFSAKLRLAEGE